MYVCLCHGFTDRQVRAAIDEAGIGSTAEVYRHFDCKPQCGKCVPYVSDIVRAAKAAAEPCGRCGEGRCTRAHHD